MYLEVARHGHIRITGNVRICERLERKTAREHCMLFRKQEIQKRMGVAAYTTTKTYIHDMKRRKQHSSFTYRSETQ
jgi:hypothetical protein